MMIQGPRDLGKVWVALLRAQQGRAHGRECDYAYSEGAVDVFDPIGVLALTVGDAPNEDRPDTGWRSGPGHDGAWLTRQHAERYAQMVGFPPEALPKLCERYDRSTSWEDIATWVETLVEAAA